METLILALINDLLLEHGAEKGITNSSYDGDNDSGSIAFDFDGKSFIINNKSVKEI